MSESFSPYTMAYDIVSQQVEDMAKRADSAITTAESVINELNKFQPPPYPPMPQKPASDPLPPEAPLPAQPDIAIDDIDPFDPPASTTTSINMDLDARISEFSPKTGVPTIPTPPTANLPGRPGAPSIPNVSIPAAPAISLPILGNLTAITIPEMPTVAIAPFDVSPVEFLASPPTTRLEWHDESYVSAMLPTIQARVAEMLSGGTGIPDVIERALFDKARAREDAAGLKARQEVFDAFAGRGFMLLTGTLVAQVNAQVEQNQLRVSDLNRDILNKAAEWEIENLRFAVQQGIALESALMNLFNASAQRSFEAARYRIEADIALFNAAVALFNARQNELTVKAQTYKTQIDAQLAQLEAYKAAVSGQQAIAATNESVVRAFAAQYEGIRAQVDIFKAEISAAQSRIEMNRARIEQYRAEISAYGDQVQVEKLKFDAYEAQMRGVQAQAGVFEAEARAFAAQVQGEEAVTNLKATGIRAKIDVIKADTERFAALISAEKERIQAQGTRAQAQGAKATAQVQMYTAKLSANVEGQRLKTQISEANMRRDLAHYEIQIKEYDAALARLQEASRLQLSAIQAAGQMASQLAAGAMSAIHMQASVTGGGHASSSFSKNVNYLVETDNPPNG